MFAFSLLVIHDTVRGGQHNLTELWTHNAPTHKRSSSRERRRQHSDQPRGNVQATMDPASTTSPVLLPLRVTTQSEARSRGGDLPGARAGAGCTICPSRSGSHRSGERSHLTTQATTTHESRTTISPLLPVPNHAQPQLLHSQRHHCLSHRTGFGQRRTNTQAKQPSPTPIPTLSLRLPAADVAQHSPALLMRPFRCTTILPERRSSITSNSPMYSAVEEARSGG